MKAIAVLFALVQFALIGAPLSAQPSQGGYGSVRTVTTESWIEEWDAAQRRWVRIAGGEATTTPSAMALPTVVTTIVNGEVVDQTRSAARYAQPVAPNAQARALGQYGPFLVIAPDRATMIGSTDSRSPHHFDAMLRDFPAIATLEMVEAPGTSNDIANLEVGRKIRSAGIATHVPRGGSVRSGAVELFLAGVTRSIEEGAQFAVHSWLDNYGREADDFDADHPAHRLYLDYYTEMGMSEDQARAFYAMTNSVPHSSARWLVADEMRRWIAPPRAASRHLAALDAAAPDPIALCMICRMADQSLAETARHVSASAWERYAFEASAPAIHYGDVSRINVAHLGATLLDSRMAFP